MKLHIPVILTTWRFKMPIYGPFMVSYYVYPPKYNFFWLNKKFAALRQNVIFFCNFRDLILNNDRVTPALIA